MEPVSCAGKHEPVEVDGIRITATFGKDNLPGGTFAAQSRGTIAVCLNCPAIFIKHDEDQGFHEKFTELERPC